MKHFGAERVRHAILILTVLTTGLYAGFCLAYQLTVVPGLRTVGDDAYVASMRALNAATPSVPFAVIFGGSAVLLVASTVLGRRRRSSVLPLAAALGAYAVVVVVTLLGNVPLNGALTEAGDAGALRDAFEQPWAAFHTARTVLAVLAFGLTAVAATRTAPAVRPVLPAQPAVATVS